jgi:hypothetical protein
VDIPPADAIPIADRREAGILAHRADGQNEARDLAASNLPGDRSREMIEKPRDIRLEMNANTGPLAQLSHTK